MVFISSYFVFVIEEKRKKVFGISYSKNMANFQAFLWSFSSCTNPEIVRCEPRTHVPQRLKSKFFKKNLKEGLSEQKQTCYSKDVLVKTG